MLPTIKKGLLAASGLASVVLAVTGVSSSDMANLLNNGGQIELAMMAQPMWFFGQAMNRPPCIPTYALDSNNQQTPSAALCDYPNVGCNCRNPGVAIGNPSPSFPVYFSYSQCNETEIRVQYSLFYEKDGVNPAGVFGHAYDWERIIVVWALNSDNIWRQNYLLLSSHSGYINKPWASIQNTFNTQDGGLKYGGDDARQNLDHPKVYVAWFKHNEFDTRNTGWNDIVSQLDDFAFRSRDWWRYNTADDYIQCDGGTQCGQIIGAMNWGDASSNPPSVHWGLCSAA